MTSGFAGLFDKLPNQVCSGCNLSILWHNKVLNNDTYASLILKRVLQAAALMYISSIGLLTTPIFSSVLNRSTEIS